MDVLSFAGEREGENPEVIKMQQVSLSASEN